jgi:hypothetical protein
MDDHEQGFGKGLLKGLKKVLFTDEAGESSRAASTGAPVPRVGDHEKAMHPGQAVPPVSSDLKKDPAPIRPGSPGISDDSPATPGDSTLADMKRNVYALLENINQNGVDFFEVWNAAKEMGGASPANIRAAFTSLRFADRTLSKESLVRSGREYVQALQRVIETETSKRLQEKISLETQREQTRKRLDTDITRIEEEMNALRQKLAAMHDERQGIDADFDPRIHAIETKINAGRKAVDEVLSDMRAVIGIMERDIN